MFTLLPRFYFPFILSLPRASPSISLSCSFSPDSPLLSQPHLVLIEVSETFFRALE